MARNEARLRTGAGNERIADLGAGEILLRLSRLQNRFCIAIRLLTCTGRAMSPASVPKRLPADPSRPAPTDTEKGLRAGI